MQATMKDSSCVSADDDHTSLDKLVNYHSSWCKLKESVAWILKIRSELLQKKLMKGEDQVSVVEDNKQPDSGHITLEDLEKAEVTILYYV